MLVSTRFALLMCAGAIHAFTPAIAQTAEPAEQDVPQDAGLGDIVVTAQFREQNLQETPIAITAIGAEDIQQRGLTSLTQINAVAPNLQLRPAGAEHGNAMQAMIRGVGQNDSSFAFEPAVGIYVDDVYYSTLFGSQLALLDLERIEVLRGPQGTLFGKNSLGGAVRLITKTPRGDNSGFVEATYGSLNRLALRGAFDAPITDTLFLRISGAGEKRDGYQKIYDFACARPSEAGTIPTSVTGPSGSAKECQIGTYGGMDTLAARAQLRFVPNDALEINVTADYSRDRSEAPPITVTTLEMTPYLEAWNNQANIPLYGVAYDTRFRPTDPLVTYADNRDPTLGYVGTRHAPVDSWGATATIDYELGANLGVKSITSYRETDGSFGTDIDGSPLQIQNVEMIIATDQFSQELRLTGNAVDDRLNFTVGGFYFRANQHLRGGVQNSLFGLNFQQNDRFRTTNYSAYANGDFRVTDELSVVAGLRYSWESKSFAFDHEGFLTVDEPVVAEYGRVDYRLAVNYRIAESTNIYGSIASGFRSGGFNPRPFNASQLTSFGPEKMVAYEIGIKNELFDRRVRLNVAAFLSDYTDRIISVTGIDETGTPFEMPMNIGTAKIRGVEGELVVMPAEGLRLEGSFGYAKFTAPELEGLRQVGVPDWTASVSAEYSVPVGEGAVTGRIDWAYQSRVDYALSNDDRAATPGRGIFNARLNWDLNDHLSAALAVTNLFDAEYYVQKMNYLDFGYGLVNGQPGRPREWSISLRHNF